MTDNTCKIDYKKLYGNAAKARADEIVLKYLRQMLVDSEGIVDKNLEKLGAEEVDLGIMIPVTKSTDLMHLFVAMEVRAKMRHIVEGVEEADAAVAAEDDEKEEKNNVT
jgi:hypothetical protein